MVGETIMKFLISLALSAFLAVPAAADQFRVNRDATFYGCNTPADVMDLIKASLHPAYPKAVAQVAGFAASVCPEAGPFPGVLHATIVEAEPFRKIPGYDYMALVKWRYADSQRVYHTVLVRSAFTGLWFDAVDAVIETRTVGGVIEEIFKSR
jgi:hypothetical protein